MSAAIVFEDDRLKIPPNVGTFEEFRNWARSPQFPERGRIDFLDDTIEIDALQDELKFEIFRRGRIGWIRSRPDAGGFRWSEVFQRRFRLTGRPSPAGGWRYDLKTGDSN